MLKDLTFFQTNTVSLSSAVFPTEVSFPYQEDFCYLFEKIARICNTGVREGCL
jgi:hypothetical protein